MDLTDAVIVSGLGLAVVFSGLVLTSLLIVGFNVLPTLGRHRERRATPVTDPSETPGEVPSDARVLAVITAVIEVERRLRRGESGGRLTIERGS